MSRSFVGHDERFVNAWKNGGWEVDTVALGDLANLDSGQLSSELTKLRQRIEGFRPDVIQAGPVHDVAWAVTQTWGGPLIATSWGFDLMNDVYANELARERAVKVMARADQVIVDNNGPRRVAIALGASAEAIVQFPWGVDLNQFRPAPRDFLSPHRIKTILTTRRHERIYGVGVIIDAFMRVADSVPDIRLVLAGGGSLTSEYGNRVSAAGLADRVTFLDEVIPSGLPAIYRAADLYVSASTVDGTSVSLLEAMACGVPVLVSDIEGNREWVNSDTGYSFTQGSVDEVARFFERFGSGEAELNNEFSRRSENALQMVRSKADWEATAARFPEIAAQAIAQQSAS